MRAWTVGLGWGGMPFAAPFRRPRLDLGPKPKPLRGAGVSSGLAQRPFAGQPGAPSCTQPPFGPQIKSGATGGGAGKGEATGGAGFGIW